MQKVWPGVLLALEFVLSSTSLSRQTAMAATSNDSLRLVLHEHRQSPLDLEISGERVGLATGTIRYVSRAQLLKLPQVNYSVSDDANFKKKVELSGVLLEELSKALSGSRAGSLPKGLIVAICTDQYHAHYPADYVQTHHPVLVLKIDGQGPAEWPKDSEGHDAYIGPYLISHATFTPSFKIFAHDDEPQIPWGVMRLEFRDEQKVFSSIAPRGPHADDADVHAGFRIAQQNCFRCHNLGNEGGTKSGRPWPVLALWAASIPKQFSSYVRNPLTANPKSQMAASPQYDDETMRALINYFKTFATRE
jgi:mono/diheme cytochrome c family protein